ncbi:MAG: hypothetical protein IJ104_11685 [Methanobrevibacter sp.]|nr:hypothetical protein [Methanobrevibacter sp.]
MNKNQIDYYIENGEFSYALAYLKYNHDHGGNLTYDKVYNAVVHGDYGKTKNWIFYNNGTATRNITMHYNNGTNITIPYSTTYKTDIRGTAKWWDMTDIFEDGRPVIVAWGELYRTVQGYFMTTEPVTLRNNAFDNENITNHSMTTINNESNQNSSLSDQIASINNVSNQNTSISNQTMDNSSSIQYGEYTIVDIIRNTGNPLIILLIVCLIPFGIQKKKDNKK